MKQTLLLPLFILFIHCGNTKNNNENKTTENLKNVVLKNSSCPEDGICTIEIIKNKSLLLKNDEIDALYYQMTDNDDTSIIKFEYQKNTEKELQDANYREELIFEIKNTDTYLKLENDNLKTIKMLFGKHCFCRGQAGYYNVKEGKFNLTKENGGYTISLNFITNEVPQVIKKINAFVQ